MLPVDMPEDHKLMIDSNPDETWLVPKAEIDTAAVKPKLGDTAWSGVIGVRI